MTIESDGTDTAPDLEQVVSQRLESSAWSSGLSVSSFASCIALGMEPAAFVQGFAVMQWGWYTPRMGYGGFGMSGLPTVRGQYSEQWQCPHGFVGGEHRSFGFNYEQAWVEDNWSNGWNLAYSRMLQEAEEAGAHGVIGVVDEVRHLSTSGTAEFRIQGTAVKVPGSPRTAHPFTTFLSGQRLAKLLETGYVPVSLVATLSSVQMVANCITHYRLSGAGSGMWSGDSSDVSTIAQVNRAQIAARRLAREKARAQLGHDILHGASVEQFEREAGEGDLAIQCSIKGTRVRRFKKAVPQGSVTPVVRLT